ncbi:MAG: glycoside hydrolase family 127 protein [Clostridia bacterium]|nr:glycoside hydrolase family 127 protein [Clostridia bacterium]
MKAVSFDRVTLGGFWGQWLEKLQAVTLPTVYDRFSETGRFEAFEFRWKAGDPKQPHIFWDSDVAKWIEAAADLLAQRSDPALEAVIDRVVELIALHRDPCGYFNIYFTVCEPEQRFQRRTDHELYCAGHLTEAAIAYYRATGKDRFLRLMQDYMAYIKKVFIEEDRAAFSTPGHEEIELALVRLWETTGDEQYLEMSRYFVDQRGVSPKDIAGGHNNDYDQSDRPVRDITEAIGHSVRAVYLYCAMADLARLTADDALRKACERVFRNITERRMYLTGGIGSAARGERFTEDYDLPNDVDYAETCAAIGLAFFARRMSLLAPDSRYADAAETAIYNGVLSGISLRGNAFFYVNPLEINLQQHRIEKDWYHRDDPLLTQRVEVFSCSCCPPNIARMIASIGDFLYSYDEQTVFVHHYFESKAAFDGVTLTQTTGYPFEGEIRLRAQGLRGKTLALRLPGWADAPLINGQAPADVRAGYAYLPVEADDVTISLSLDLTPRLMAADVRVHADRGKAAVCRGPLVYCMEQIDQAVPLGQLVLSADLQPTVAQDAALGCPALEVNGFRELPAAALYTRYPPDRQPCRLRMIPYFAFANRGESDMQVWTRI